MKKLSFFLNAFLSFIAVNACHTANEKRLIEEDGTSEVTIKPGLISKIDLATSGQKQKPAKILITENLLPLYKITRKKTELRNGPGLTFALKDSFLQKNDKVFILEKYSIWRKVYAPSMKKIGWVHFKTLDLNQIHNDQFYVSIETFPLVFTKSDDVKVFDFKTKTPLNERLPKGYAFYALNKTDTMILVYIPTTKTVAWMQRGDVI